MSRTIPAISLLQPWASLVAVGAKRVETRSWRTKHRGLLAIHASKGYPRDCRDFAGTLGVRFALGNEALPQGKVVAVCRVVDCRTTDDRGWVDSLTEAERYVGDFSPKRYGWLLEDIRRLPVPVEAKGALSLWQWDVPGALWEQLGLAEMQAAPVAPPLGGLFAAEGVGDVG